jgi:hypothetical protein
MHLAIPASAKRRGHRTPRRRQPFRALDQIKLYTLRIDQLRHAIRRNQVSFPNPVPTFERHDRPDLQWKLVQLYFVLGWSCESIAARYGLIRQRVCQILKTWKRRAVETGCIQYIPPAKILRMAAPKYVLHPSRLAS